MGLAILLLLVAAREYGWFRKDFSGGPRGSEQGPSSLLGKRSKPLIEPTPTEMTSEIDPVFSLTPTGICEAVRNGNLELVQKILAEKPELLTAKNPANWANLPEMKVNPWASRPVEIAAVFGHGCVSIEFECHGRGSDRRLLRSLRDCT